MVVDTFFDAAGELVDGVELHAAVVDGNEKVHGVASKSPRLPGPGHPLPDAFYESVVVEGQLFRNAPFELVLDLFLQGDDLIAVELAEGFVALKRVLLFSLGVLEPADVVAEDPQHAGGPVGALVVGLRKLHTFRLINHRRAPMIRRTTVKAGLDM